MSASLLGGAMGASRGIYQEIVRLQQAGTCAALASPVRIVGSVPCVSQSRLLVRQDGSALGTIGGGLLEAEVLRRAPEVISSGEPAVLDFELRQDEAAAAGMICGGSCSVLIEPIPSELTKEAFEAAAQSESIGSRIVLITALSEDSLRKLALLLDGVLVGSTGDADTDSMLRELAERCGTSDEPMLIEEPLRVCIQPLISPPPVYIFGAGHVAIPVEQLARLVGFRTVVIDDRAEFANAERFPQADQVLVASVDDAFDALSIGEGAYVVSVTRGHSFDEDVVAHALRTPAKYIGMIGSKRKVASICQRLHDRGFTDADIARIHAPIGVEIGAETVEEIALSIAAELVAVRRLR